MSGSFSRLGAALLAWALSVAVVHADQEDVSWVGKRIILQRDGVRIGHTDDNGRPVYVADLTDMVYRVLGESDGWLRVRQRSTEGWFAKDSAVLLEEAIPYFTSRLRSDSRDALAFAHRGRAWQEKGELDRALQDYDDAIRVATVADEPRFGPFGLRVLIARRPTTTTPQASWFRGRGVIYDRKGQSDKAIREFTEAVRLNPADPLSYVDRGITYKGMRDYDNAIADHSDAIRLDPQWASAYFNRANVFKARKEYNKALADYSAAIRLDPKDPDAYFNRANTYRAAKNYAKAADDWSEVVRLDANDAEARDRLGWLLATCPDGRVRNGPKCRQSRRCGVRVDGWKITPPPGHAGGRVCRDWSFRPRDQVAKTCPRVTTV